MDDDLLRARIAQALADDPLIGGDAVKKIVGDTRHRVMELWAEERAKQLGVFKTAAATPDSVVEVSERAFAARRGSFKPRWELIAAIVFGDASPPSCREAIRLYELARGAGSAKERYVGRGSPPGPHRRPPRADGR